jgi:hypothetical protein
MKAHAFQSFTSPLSSVVYLVTDVSSPLLVFLLVMKPDFFPMAIMNKKYSLDDTSSVC